jgi:hypothetical protein
MYRAGTSARLERDHHIGIRFPGDIGKCLVEIEHFPYVESGCTDLQFDRKPAPRVVVTTVAARPSSPE